MGVLVQFGVQCLIIDDAHDLSLEHLIFLKELTDQGRLPPYDHPLGLCLVTAGRGNTIPLKEIFDQPETMWIQFRRRLDRLQPFCRIAGHSSEEVREILAALETVYREPFPHLNLRQGSGAIYTWLTQPVLDPTSSGRVAMDYLMKLVATALDQRHPNGDGRKREIQSQKTSRPQSRDRISRTEKHHRHRSMLEVLSYPQSPSEPDALGNRSPKALLLANERQKTSNPFPLVAQVVNPNMKLVGEYNYSGGRLPFSVFFVFGPSLLRDSTSSLPSSNSISALTRIIILLPPVYCWDLHYCHLLFVRQAVTA